MKQQLKQSRATETIKSAFLEDYTKNARTISVTELCRLAHVARTTFYEHYESVGAVLEEIEDKLIAEFHALAKKACDGSTVGINFPRFLEETFVCMEAHRPALTALMVLHPSKRFEEKWKDTVKMLFKTRSPKHLDDHATALIAEGLSAAIVASYGYYLRHAGSVDAAEIQRIIMRMADTIRELRG